MRKKAIEMPASVRFYRAITKVDPSHTIHETVIRETTVSGPDHEPLEVHNRKTVFIPKGCPDLVTLPPEEPWGAQFMDAETGKLLS
jgi:hypothetical protein